MGIEWYIVGGVVLLLFGGSQIPKLARSLGSASKEFKQGQAEADAEANKKKGVSDKTDAPVTDPKAD